MRIDRTGHGPAPGAARGRRAAVAFAAPAAAPDSAPAAEATLTAATVLPLALLPDSATEAPPDAADPACAAHGRALLGALAGLQLATLGGNGGHARQTLAELARALPRAADPGLDAVLLAIAQRAAIELARAG